MNLPPSPASSRLYYCKVFSNWIEQKGREFHGRSSEITILKKIITIERFIRNIKLQNFDKKYKAIHDSWRALFFKTGLL